MRPQREKLIADILSVFVEWGFLCIKAHIKIVAHLFINEEGRVVRQWKDYLPGYDFVNDFAARSNLT